MVGVSSMRPETADGEQPPLRIRARGIRGVHDACELPAFYPQPQST
jgi:hypothetical protein